MISGTVRKRGVENKQILIMLHCEKHHLPNPKEGSKKIEVEDLVTEISGGEICGGEIHRSAAQKDMNKKEKEREGKKKLLDSIIPHTVPYPKLPARDFAKRYPSHEILLRKF